MRSILISDNRDSLIGMRMAGIEGYLVETPEETWEQIQNAIKDPNIGMIFLTELAADMVADDLLKFRESSVFPLISIIPDRHGFRKANKITKIINEAIGM